MFNNQGANPGANYGNNFINFGKEALALVAYDNNNSFRDMRREQVLQSLVELCAKYGFENLGAGQNRFVVGIDSNYVMKIAFRGYGVQDNIGEYKFTEYCVSTNSVEVLNMITHCQLHFSNAAMNAVFNPLKNGGLIVIQKRVRGLKEIARAMQMQKGVVDSLSGICSSILNIDAHKRRYDYMIGILSPHCFLFDLGRDKPFNFGLDEHGILRILDYGYIRLITQLDAETRHPLGTFTVSDNGVTKLKCMHPECHKAGAMLVPAIYPTPEDVDMYVCQKCKNTVSSLTLKDIYGI